MAFQDTELLKIDQRLKALEGEIELALHLQPSSTILVNADPDLVKQITPAPLDKSSGVDGDAGDWTQHGDGTGYPGDLTSAKFKFEDGAYSEVKTEDLIPGTTYYEMHPDGRFSPIDTTLEPHQPAVDPTPEA